ncbi:hypothetical protein ACO1O0_003499 [Amphichorda felina]
MSSLSSSLKALIGAPHARPGPLAVSSPQLRAVLSSIASEASSHQLSPRPWIALSAAALFALNAPDGLPILHALASSSSSSSSSPPSSSSQEPVVAAELIREVGLKCISFNGIPRSINGLNAFRASLPAPVASRLRTTPTRSSSSPSSPSPSSPSSDAETLSRGRRLWHSVYAPLDNKLIAKLALAHPDLPVVILQSHYGPLLADPPPRTSSPGSVGRLLTSVVAVAALRAQSGVAPQVVSHVLGLRKGVADGSYRADEPCEGEGGARWLASDEGGEWILRSVDRIVEVVGGGGGASFGAPREVKI